MPPKPTNKPPTPVFLNDQPHTAAQVQICNGERATPTILECQVTALLDAMQSQREMRRQTQAGRYCYRHCALFCPRLKSETSTKNPPTPNANRQVWVCVCVCVRGDEVMRCVLLVHRPAAAARSSFPPKAQSFRMDEGRVKINNMQLVVRLHVYLV